MIRCVLWLIGCRAIMFKVERRGQSRWVCWQPISATLARFSADIGILLSSILMPLLAGVSCALWWDIDVRVVRSSFSSIPSATHVTRLIHRASIQHSALFSPQHDCCIKWREIGVIWMNPRASEKGVSAIVSHTYDYPRREMIFSGEAIW